MSLIHLPREGLFSREDRAVDVKRNYFAQDRALILWVYTIFSLLLRGGCFGILYLARRWEFLEHPSFPFLGCLHPQVPLHKAVGSQRGRKGGQARQDCRFGGCEGGLTRSRALPDPGSSGPSALHSSSPPACSAATVLSTASPGLLPISCLSLLFFLIETEGSVSYI